MVLVTSSFSSQATLEGLALEVLEPSQGRWAIYGRSLCHSVQAAVGEQNLLGVLGQTIILASGYNVVSF